jgi:nicotinamide mononucleotide adenylyltransferase
LQLPILIHLFIIVSDMEKYERHIKNGLFLLVLLLLWLPMVQTKFKFFQVQPLKGAVEATSDPYISKERWFSGVYQKEQEAYVKDSFGFREPFIRLYNQWQYSFYNHTSAHSVVIGRSGYLYEENYIKAHLGLDFIGEDSIRGQVDRLKTISDSLKKKNIDLVVLLAPGKGSFYPEYFPEKYDQVKKGVTNADVYKKYFKQKDIHLLDAHSWFLQMKYKEHKQHRLYSKTGIHWSKYGEYIVADSLLRYLSELRGVEFPAMKLIQEETSSALRSTDNDIWQGMNLWMNMSDYKMTYPIVQRTGEEHNQTKVLTIADSYFWGLYWMGLPEGYFSNGEFWYYFEQRYPQQFTTPSLVNEINIRSEVEKNNVVLLILTDANLPRFGFGFLEKF